MRMYVISDNNDTLAGMRLSGVDGVVLHERDEVTAELDRLFADNSIGVILITSKLRALAGDHIDELKRKSQMPLILDIPDRHGERKE